MNGLRIENISGVDCYEKNGTAYLKLEAVARGLGFTKTDVKVSESGFRKEYVRIDWPRVRKYLDELGFHTCVENSVPTCGNDDFIPENIFYRLAMKAKNETAEKFQAKVADEIIPSIRRHGIYATDDVIDNMMNNPQFMADIIAKLKEESEARKAAEHKNAILTHVNKTYTMTEIAKELGLKSAMKLNRMLSDQKVQYQVNGTWVMYSQYSDLGYEEIKQEVLDNGKVIYYRKITQLGREFILNLFNGDKCSM